MNILITGGTGFIGQNLIKDLLENGHHVFVLTRNPHSYDDEPNLNYINYEQSLGGLPIIHAVINLAGESLFGLWTKRKKSNIFTSRMETTKKLISFMERMKEKPEVFITASAVGYYGTSTKAIFTEKTQNPGNDFLAHVVSEWEQTAKQAESLGIRTVYTRFGIVLGKQGALPLMSLPIKCFAGGPIGKGEQWMSWIHIKDVVQLILFCLDNEKITGPINMTSPNPKRNKDFIKVLANVLKRPYWFPTPSPLLKVTLGEMSEIITKGQYVLPQKAIDYQYPFIYPNLQQALSEIYKKK